jgi:meso-butanediol dehydrogenase / (S,S)-butanediol dehydrogenase / diacetyl reductase
VQNLAGASPIADDATGARIALVTGAARGIGREIALRFARDGLDVAVADLPHARTESEALVQEICAMGRRAIAIVADVSDARQIDAMVAATARELGRLDVMVANAGIAAVAPLLDVSPEDFDRLMAVNVRGVFLCYTAAARQMIEQGGGGKIIGAASIAAHKGFAMLGHYSASKWAVRGLTQVAAQEWARHGITVNAYCPGIVGTQMWEHIDERLAELQGLRPGQALERISRLISLGRVQTPKDVAAFVSYLASRDSDYMTGQSVIIDGGVLFS